MHPQGFLHADASGSGHVVCRYPRQGGASMPRAVIHLGDPAGQALVQGVWKYARGYVPGQLNEGLVAQAAGSPARLADYDDTAWEICRDLTARMSHGFSFMWYRIRVTFPQEVDGHPIQ